MPSRTRTNSRVQAKSPGPSRFTKIYGFDPHPPNKMTTRNRTVSYQESDTDDDDEVIYVGQRPKPKVQRSVPTFERPKIILGEEEYLVERRVVKEIPAIKKQRAIEAIPAVREKRIVVGEVAVEGQGSAIFQTLPYEVHQNIARYLEEDSDVLKYAELCKQTRDSISSSVWRQRFVRTFDMPEEQLGPLALAKKYAYRRDVAGWVCFDWKKFGVNLSRQERKIQEANAEKCLQILRDLILDSNAYNGIDVDGNQTIVGLNHDYMRDWVTHGRRRHTDVIDAVINTEITNWEENDVVSATTENSLVLVIQLCLSSLSLHPDCCNSTVSHFDMSQRQAYTDHKKQPVFVGGWKQDINVRWLLHTVNFFKLHLKASSGEGLLAQHYEELERGQLPQPWLGRIKGETESIGSHWKSAYTFMKDNATLSRLRVRGNDDEPMVDDGEMFSDLTIFFDDSKFSSDNWPKAFETLINSNPYVTTSPQRGHQRRAANATIETKYQLKTFYGTSRGSRPAHFYGRIHGLPEQQGIPGFQRISLIKFFPNNGEYDPCNVWAYEGCVLPGGRIIVGRWWDLTADPRNPVNIFGGPFVWWNVDNSAAEPAISSEEALEFLESIHDPNMGFS